MQANTPSIGNAEYYAKIVEELALLRRLVSVAGEISELGYSVPEDVSEVLDRAESLVFDVAQRRVVDTMTPLEELLGATLDHLELLFSRGESVTGLATGYTDLDEQLAQSRAALEQARSGLELARVEQQRWAAMVKDSVVTVDEYDQKTQSARAATAVVAAGEADVRRLQALQSFEHVTAPFDGIVTGRNVDVGAFVQSGGGTGSSMPSNGSSAPSSLFQMVQTDTVRVYITVPQSDATSIEAGQSADVRVQEFPNQVFPGRVVRTARAVDPQSRTLLTEVQIVNRKHVLLPGMYAEIRFVVSRTNPPLVVPATALLPLTDGIHVVEVDADNRVHHRKITIVRDYGDYVEVDAGVTEGASVVLNPGDGLTDGTRVRVLARPVPADSAPARKLQQGKN